MFNEDDLQLGTDQRMILQWIQDHIHLVGGDKTKVIAMGQLCAKYDTIKIY
jgi:carboxylesterase type B